VVGVTGTIEVGTQVGTWVVTTVGGTTMVSVWVNSFGDGPGMMVWVWIITVELVITLVYVKVITPVIGVGGTTIVEITGNSVVGNGDGTRVFGTQVGT
jgi:hypothetical protein